MKRVSEDIEAVGYYYAGSAEEAYMSLAPPSAHMYDDLGDALDSGSALGPLYRVTFKVERID